MKINHFLFIIVLGMTGCASTVKTYDVQGNLIGSCHATSGLIFKKESSCYGYSNQQGFQFIPVSAKQLKLEQNKSISSTQQYEIKRLEDLPQNRKINLSKF